MSRIKLLHQIIYRLIGTLRTAKNIDFAERLSSNGYSLSVTFCTIAHLTPAPERARACCISEAAISRLNLSIVFLLKCFTSNSFTIFTFYKVGGIDTLFTLLVY